MKQLLSHFLQRQVCYNVNNKRVVNWMPLLCLQPADLLALEER